MAVLDFLVCLLVLQVCSGQPDFAQIFFKSNLQEFLNYPITFEKPLPSWLKGTMVRNGLGRFEVGKRKVNNALDAYGKIASWTFPGNGFAFFSTKMIDSLSYNESVAKNDMAPYLFLDKVDPSFSLPEMIESFVNGVDNMNVNVFKFGDPNKTEELVLTSDYWKVYVLNQRDLTTLRKVNPPIHTGGDPLDYYIVLGSAHPLPEHGTNNYIAFASLSSLRPDKKSYFEVMRATSSDQRERIAQIEVDKASYMHSFAVSENYAVLFATPFFVDPQAVLKDLVPLDAFQWDGTAKTKLYVVNLKTGETKILETENMFFLHVANAYETADKKIVVDVCTFPNPSAMRRFTMSTVLNPALRRNNSMGYYGDLKRYTLDLEKEDVTVHVFGAPSKVPLANNLDFPTINEKYRSTEYCFIYGITYNYDNKDFLKGALVKKDVCQGTREQIWVNDGKILNEVLFLPDPSGTDEDDGILITPVFDTRNQTTNITIFDAKTLAPINTAMLPTNIPFGTHGHFFDQVLLD